jgi:hypothetical protein
MPEQFENPQAAKLEDATVAEESAEKKIEHTAEKAATKSTKTVQKYDQDRPVFSK